MWVADGVIVRAAVLTDHAYRGRLVVSDISLPAHGSTVSVYLWVVALLSVLHTYINLIASLEESSRHTHTHAHMYAHTHTHTHTHRNVHTHG